MKKALTEIEMKRKMRRKKIRKRRLTFFLIFLLVAGIGVFCLLLKTKLFPIKSVAVKGSEIYSSRQIVKASGINNRTPILSISESKLKKTLQKKLPYVDDVKIKIDFPEKVTITVSDAKEYYAFKSEDGYFSASKNLNVLNLYGEKPEGEVEVSANELKLDVGQPVEFGDDAKREIFELIIKNISENGIKLNSLDITDSVHLKITVEDRFEVNLGSRDNLEEKIKHLSAMISKIGDRKGKINLEMWSKNDSKGTFIAENT